MNLDHTTDKQLQTLERLAGELLVVMRQAKIQEETLIEELRQLQIEAGNVRRARYDNAAHEYDGF